MKTNVSPCKLLFQAFFFVLLTVVGMGSAAAQTGSSPGLPGDHGLSGNQNANEEVPTQVQQVLTLDAGWNWVSLYLNCDAGLLSTLQEKIAQNNTEAMLKNMEYSTLLQSGSWSVSELTLTNESMYMLNLESPTTVTLTGTLANPTDHPITLKTGWNWFGFPLNHPLSLAEALSSITPHKGDLIKYMVGSASYNGTTWEGSLQNLEPGAGYMYYNNGANMTLTAPSK